MLKVKLGQVVEYASHNETFMQRAVKEFFGKTVIDLREDNIEIISGLFNEWLIFDFKISNGRSPREMCKKSYRKNWIYDTLNIAYYFAYSYRNASIGFILAALCAG